MTDYGFNFDNSYTRLPETFYTKQPPTPVDDPALVILNETLAGDMGLDFSGADKLEQAALFSGNKLPDGADPLAQAYAGHQFGQFTMLGDGRALIWGEHVTPDGQRLDIQYKGSGRTPYSRRGDGRAALGPMLREYIISEAMHALGIPSTRSLAVATTGEPVHREKPLEGAILTRVARSHIRVGTFEYAAAQQDKDLVETLVDYTIGRHAPEVKDTDNKALAYLNHVMDKQADLIVNWMRVGFIHGVMNTDNMALSGETIDYGPCAFMDEYHPATVFSSIDHRGRYAYGNQPPIAQWNLARFAETLLPLLHDTFKTSVKIAEDTIDGFSALYHEKWLTMMRQKLGLKEARAEDEALITDLLDWMKENEADYTNTFRDVSQSDAVKDPPNKALYHSDEFRAWYKRWVERRNKDGASPDEAAALMKRSNPAVIPRNHKVEGALTAATEDNNMTPFHDMLAAVTDPYNDHPSLAPYQTPPAPHERVLQTFCGT